MSNQKKQSTEAAVREIRRRSRRKFSPEEKIRIVLEGLRGEQSISDLCRREGIASNLYYRWSKDFLEAGKQTSPYRPARESGCGVRGDDRAPHPVTFCNGSTAPECSQQHRVTAP